MHRPVFVFSDDTKPIRIIYFDRRAAEVGFVEGFETRRIAEAVGDPALLEFDRRRRGTSDSTSRPPSEVVAGEALVDVVAGLRELADFLVAHDADAAADVGQDAFFDGRTGGEGRA